MSPHFLLMSRTCRTFSTSPSKRMGILDPHLADDIDVTASELLRQLDPEPLELLTTAMLGGGGSEEPEVYVDGVPR